MEAPRTLGSTESLGEEMLLLYFILVHPDRVSGPWALSCERERRDNGAP
jgi:hypothetical protein